MGRPDLTEVRTAEILDAFERCVARFGLEGSSLERVAEEAGMKRSILRHYIGNRDDLINALADRVDAKYRSYLQGFVDSVSEDQRVKQLIEFFLPDQPFESSGSVLVVEALIAASEQYPRIREQMSAYIDDLVTTIAQQLRMAYPKATSKSCWNVAYGIVSISFNQESLISLNLSDKYLKAARKCAYQLVATLES